MRPPRAAVLALCCASVACITAAATGLTPASAASAATAATAAAGTQHVIVLLKDQHPAAPAGAASLATRERLVGADQAPVGARVRALGGAVTHTYRAVNAVAATVPAGRAAQLLADPQVAAVVPDLPRTVDPASLDAAQHSALAAATPQAQGLCPTDPRTPLLEPEALSVTHTASQDPSALTARSLGYTGKGVTVAFIADGLDPNNPDFRRADGSPVFTDYQDFSGDGPNAPSSGAEAFGDASSIAAQGQRTYDLANWVNSAHPLPKGCTVKVEGIAPGASLVGLKIFPNALLTAPTSVIVQAIDYAVTHDHVDVINESFGSNPYPDTATDPVSVLNHDAVDAGVTVVASSGDSGIGGSNGTASTDPWVISAGASTTLQQYAQRTAYGFQLGNGRWVGDQTSALSSAGITQTNRVVDLMAPGDLGWAVCSAQSTSDGSPRFPGCTNGNGQPSALESFGGTSEASPFVAGAAALVVEAYRKGHGGASPTPAQVRRVLDSSADDLGLPAEEQGAGRLNTYRAVQLASSLGTGANTGGGLSTDLPYTSNVVAAGSTVTAKVVVRNDGAGTQRVSAAVRDVGGVIAQQKASVALDPAGPHTFVDGSGIPRSYTLQSVDVPAGTDRLDALISWGGAGASVRLSLLDPQGTYSGYSLPQGSGNVGEVDVHQPAAGRWTAVVWTSASSSGYSGPVSLTTTDYRDRAVGTVSPASLVLGQGQSATVTVTTTAPAQGASAASLVLTGRFGQATTVPLVTRAVQAVSAATPATFSGTFRHGNGRSFGPAQTDTFLFDVPAGARDLDVDLALAGVPPQQVVAHLSDASGEPVSTTASYRPAGTGATSDPGLEIVHARPAAGRYQLTLELINPVSGAPLPQGFSGSVSLDRAQVLASGVPGSTATTLARGTASTATVRVTNTSPQPQTYYVDARTTALRSYDLVPVGPSTVALPLASEDVPSWLVPTRVQRLTVGASATAPLAFDVMALDNPTALNAPSAPDVEALSSGNGATAVHTAAEVTSSLWGAFPALTGPTSGSQTGSVSMTASVLAEGFDGAVTSSTGDPLLATVRAPLGGTTPPAATPLTLAPGATATLTVTVRPTAARGTHVQGFLYVNTLSPYGPSGQSGLGDEVAAVPYAYTVG